MTPESQTQAGPATEAGRVLRMAWISEGRWSRDPSWLSKHIRAIEREATERATAAVDVERLHKVISAWIDSHAVLNRSQAQTMKSGAFTSWVAAEYARLSGESDR